MTAIFKYIDLSYLDQMCDGDQEMRQTMLRMILQELPDEIQKIPALCQQHNWSEVHAVSHKLKSTLSFVGNDNMTDINKKIEAGSKHQQNDKNIGQLAESLLEALPNVMADLKKAMS